MVGCHDGKVSGCTFRHRGDTDGSGVQTKGGSKDTAATRIRSRGISPLTQSNPNYDPCSSGFANSSWAGEEIDLWQVRAGDRTLNSAIDG